MTAANSATATGVTPSPERGWTGRVIVQLIVLVFAGESVALAYSAPTVAMGEIAQHFETDQIAWLTTALLLSGSVLAPLTGKLADLYGKRKMFLIVIAVGILGSIVCAIAPTYGVFLLGRVLQGAVIASSFLGVSLIRDVFPTRTVALGVGIVSTGFGVIASVIPFALGALADAFGFEAIFWFTAAYGVVLLVALRILVPETTLRASGRVDVLGAALLGGGIAALLAYVSLGNSLGWTSPLELGLLGGAVVLLAVWVFQALHVKEPLVDLRFIRRLPILITLLIAGIGVGGANVFNLMIITAVQTPVDAGLGFGLGANALDTARFLSVINVGVLTGGILAGQLVKRMQAAWVAFMALTLMVVVSVASIATLSTNVPLLVVCLFLGIAIGMATAIVFLLIVELVAPDVQGRISGVATVCINIFASLWPVVAFTVLNANFLVPTDTGGMAYSLAGLQVGLVIPGILALIGALAALALVATTRRAKRFAPAEQQPLTP